MNYVAEFRQQCIRLIIHSFEHSINISKSQSPEIAQNYLQSGISLETSAY